MVKVYLAVVKETLTNLNSPFLGFVYDILNSFKISQHKNKVSLSQEGKTPDYSLQGTWTLASQDIFRPGARRASVA